MNNAVLELLEDLRTTALTRRALANTPAMKGTHGAQILKRRALDLEEIADKLEVAITIDESAD